MPQSATKLKKQPIVDTAELLRLPKEELVERIRRLEAANLNFKNILAKRNWAEQRANEKFSVGGGRGDKNADNGKRRAQKPFDFSVYNKRHVALHVAYFGWDWHGYVVQDNTAATVEAALFEALERTRLIESRETSNYHRCGRTDKGVSALGQVISIDVRSNFKGGEGIILTGDQASIADRKDYAEEIRYATILNKVLPPDIRVLAWAPVPAEFSARFDCDQRTYTYVFAKGDLNLDSMRSAGRLLVGSHDFRNFCKMDVGNGVVEFIRRLDAVYVEELTSVDEFISSTLNQSGLQLCQLRVIGSGFLWHQIRCVVALLFIIGEGLESPSIVSELLDVDKHPRKPQYNMAADYPLNLLSCEFPAVVGAWRHDPEALLDLVAHYQSVFVELSIKRAICKQALEMAASALENDAESVCLLKRVDEEDAAAVTASTPILQKQRQSQKRSSEDEKKSEMMTETNCQQPIDERSIDSESTSQSGKPKGAADDPYLRSKVRNLRKPFNSLVIGSKARKHTPLLQRPLCESLEDRVDHFVKRRRIVRVEKEGSGGKEEEEKVKGDEGSRTCDKVMEGIVEVTDDSAQISNS